MWPWLSCIPCFVKKGNRSFKSALKTALLHKLELKRSKTDIKIENDPILMLGKIKRTLKTLDRLWHGRVFQSDQVFAVSNDCVDIPKHSAIHHLLKSKW